jgi:hypothetical protein
VGGPWRPLAAPAKLAGWSEIFFSQTNWGVAAMRSLCGCVLLIIATFLLVPRPVAAEDAKAESGFTTLFNGKNLDGWKTKSGEALEGKTEAYKGRFKVADGKLVLDPKVKGDVRIVTTKALSGDTHIKFEFLPGPGCNNDLFFRGTKFDLKKPDVKNLKEGEWNVFEIIVQGDKAEFKNNGQTQRTMKTKSASSILEVRAEFGPVQFRNIRVKQAP